MGVCTSSNKRKKKNIVKVNDNTNANNITSKISKVRTFEKIVEKINKEDLKQYNQTDINFDPKKNLQKKIRSNRIETDPNELESYGKKEYK